MRLTEDQIKKSIHHDDQEVREVAVDYFAMSCSDDSAIMPLAIQAIEQYGWEHAFETYGFAKDLVQSDETILWLIGQIKKFGTDSDDGRQQYVSSLMQAVIHADVRLLERYASQILDLEGLDEKAKDAICQRVRLSTQPPEDLWHKLTEFCTRSDKFEGIPGDLNLAYDLAEALGRHPEFTVHKTLSILTGETGDAGNWMELLAVRLAGELKLHKAVAQIVKLLETADDWIFEEGERALVKTGGDEVVEQLARAYSTCGFGFRISATAILENIHSGLSVQTCLRLSEIEEDIDNKGRLLQSALMNFSRDAVEPARQFILATPLNPELLEVRSDLLVACKIMRETIPEFDQWVEESKNDTEFRKRWYRHLLPSLNEIAADDDNDEDDESLPPADSIIRQVRVGRNDPCPCGSGKKFKKCCLGKGSSV